LFLYFLGKSHAAFEEASALGDVYFKNSNTKWWDGYTGQDNVVLDELRPGGELNLTELLRLSDRYPHTIEFKGGSCQFVAKQLWITSHFHPVDFCKIGDDPQELLRRMTLKLFDEPFVALASAE